MRQYWRIILFFTLAIVVTAAAYVVRNATKPLSAIILKERAALARSLAEAVPSQDPAEARKADEKLKILGYRLAMAYNKEEKPDKAIPVLEEMIAQERAREPRTAISYHDEARYYAVLAVSYELKHDQAALEKARDAQGELISRAVEAKKKESRGEGKSIHMTED